MSCAPETEILCRRISDELRELIGALAMGILDQRQFTERVLRIEKEKVSPHGLTLSSANTLDDWTHFTLKVNTTKRVCAVLEFQPETGEFRQIHYPHGSNQHPS
jgi:hypothetical protein